MGCHISNRDLVWDRAKGETGRDIREYWGKAETMKYRGMESSGKVAEAVAVAMIR